MEKIDDIKINNMSVGEKILFEKTFFQCQIHKRQIQYIHKYFAKKQLSLLKCNSCLISQNIPINDTIFISELFEDEEHDSQYHWPFFGIQKQQEMINKYIKEYDIQQIDELFFKFKTRINEQISKIHKKLILSYEQMQQNGQRINEYFERVSQKAKFKEILQNMHKDQKSSIDELEKMIKNNNVNFHRNNVQQILKNLKCIEEDIHIKVITQKLSNIESNISKFSDDALQNVQDVVQVENDIVVKIKSQKSLSEDEIMNLYYQYIEKEIQQQQLFDEEIKNNNNHPQQQNLAEQLNQQLIQQYQDLEFYILDQSMDEDNYHRYGLS